MINYDVPTSIYIGINDRPNLYTGAAIIIFARICSAAAVVKTRFLRYHIFAPVNYKVEIIIYYEIIYRVSKSRSNDHRVAPKNNYIIIF